MEKPAQPHQIIILTALNGFKVKVGCAEILFTSRHDLVSELGRYLADPKNVEKEYTEKALYSQDTSEETPCQPESPRVTRGGGQFVESGPVNAD